MINDLGYYFNVVLEAVNQGSQLEPQWMHNLCLGTQELYLAK
jgi:hypothetical protein